HVTSLSSIIGPNQRQDRFRLLQPLQSERRSYAAVCPLSGATYLFEGSAPALAHRYILGFSHAEFTIECSRGSCCYVAQRRQQSTRRAHGTDPSAHRRA